MTTPEGELASPETEQDKIGVMENETELTIGKYQVTGILGRGAMGVVYKARDPEIGRIVAVKILKRLSGSPAFTEDVALEQFRREARAAGNLSHSNIITIYEVNTDTENPYIVMEYVEGEAVDQRLDRVGRLSPKEAIRILAQVADGLDYAHEKKVIHRDIKSSNILIDGSEHAFLVDFGVANIGESDRSDPVIGTPSYMSPEQILNDEVDHRSDIFSLGVVAFECLTGKRPFFGTDCTEVVTNVLKGIRYDITELAPDLPLALEVEFDRALSYDKDIRFASATDMVRAFAKALSINAQERETNGKFTESRGERKNFQAKPDQPTFVDSWPPSPGKALFGDIWRTENDLLEGNERRDAEDEPATPANSPTACAVQAPRRPPAVPVLLGVACLLVGFYLIWSMTLKAKSYVDEQTKAKSDPSVPFAISDLQTKHAPEEGLIEQFTDAQLAGILSDQQSSPERISGK